MRYLIAAIMCFGFCVFLGPAMGDGTSDDTSTIASSGELPELVDFAIPALPALQVLGIPATKVQRPNTLRDVVSTVANGVDMKGNLKEGFAAGGRLWDFTRIAINSDKYAASPWLLNTQWSIGAVKANTKNNHSVEAALGFQVPIIEDTYSAELAEAIKGAQTNAAVKEFAEAVQSIISAYPTVPDSLTTGLRKYVRNPSGDTQSVVEAVMRIALQHVIPEADKDLDQEIEKLRQKLEMASGDEEPMVAANLLGKTDQRMQRQEAVARYATVLKSADKRVMEAVDSRWNASGLSFAIAPAWLSQSGRSGDFRCNGTQYWLNGSLQGGSRWQHLFLLAYRDKQISWDPKIDGAFIREDDAVVVGVKSVYGSPDRGFGFELSYRDAKIANGGRDKSLSTVLSYEHRVTEAQWLQLAVGFQTGDDKQTRLSFAYNLAFGDNPNLAPPD